MPPLDGLLLLALVLLLFGVWLYQRSRCSQASSCPQAAHHALVPRRLRPRSPLECPACCLASGSSQEKEPTRAPMRPWRELKSRRGAPKRVNTQGVACPNRACSYSGIRDAQIHALVSDGSYGKAERIQHWRCQACRTVFSARLHTPMARLKTSSHQVALVAPCAGRRIRRVGG
jgi:hypothetical protein